MLLTALTPHPSVVFGVLMATLMMVSLADGKRTCYLHLRLKSNNQKPIDKDIQDFKVNSFLGTCSKIKKDCPGKALGHVKQIFGPQVNPMRGNTAINMCRFFGRELLPVHHGKVDIFYKASSCGTQGYLGIGSLCCFKCILGPYIIYHPIDHCSTSSVRPFWCP